ncbi:hypothetical protein NDU88_004425 [Pleurodeles waltl]|uniref:Uncharacterized protein n=1 Tax=Pleurodeles waltl TaxID=8319 RepID=A0AAV7M7U3_PLEWA|nr:hypothetical protein NDU88_004425 [Pleurodeles waltl]
MTEELIRDQLIMQCREKKIQERLWVAKDPSLMEAIGMAKVIEESQRCMKELSRRDKAMDVAVINPDQQDSDENEVCEAKKKGYSLSRSKVVCPCFRFIMLIFDL